MPNWYFYPLLALALLLTTLVVACQPAPSSTPPIQLPPVTESPREEKPSPASIQAKVIRVIDGDTIEVDIKGSLYKVRYIGIDTPETVHPQKPVEYLGKEAAAKNRELVEGKTVRLEKDVSETDKYGRLLRYVWVGDMMVNAELVRLGYAQVVTYSPDVKYQDLFLRLQREARENNRGLWAANDYKYYENLKYGYTIAYPSCWVLKAEAPEKVFVWTPHDASHAAMVFIYVQDFPMSIPLKEAPIDWLRVAKKEYTSLEVLSNNALQGKWDWFLKYVVAKEQGDKSYHETYFKRIDSSLYLIEILYLSATKLPELQNIVDSFEIVNKPRSNGAEFSTYQNSEYGYKIEYPQDWELIDTSPKRTIVGVSWGQIFGFVTIHTSHFVQSIDEIADTYPHYLADITTDEWKDFKVTYSHSLSGKWDWVIGFTYTDITGSEPVNGYGEVYIVQTPDYMFIVQWDSEKSQVETCKQIVDSFVPPEVKLPPLFLKIVSVTSPVNPGAYATLKAKTVPRAECTITVYYKSGPSKAQGLHPKQADTNGDVSWTWKVGTRTTPGSWRIVVTATHGGKTVSQETYFTVR